MPAAGRGKRRVSLAMKSTAVPWPSVRPILLEAQRRNINHPGVAFGGTYKRNRPPRQVAGKALPLDKALSLDAPGTRNTNVPWDGFHRVLFLRENVFPGN
jgi:hypothetical protein